MNILCQQIKIFISNSEIPLKSLPKITQEKNRNTLVDLNVLNKLNK